MRVVPLASILSSTWNPSLGPHRCKDFQLKKAKMDGRHALNALTRDTYKDESFGHVLFMCLQERYETDRFEIPEFLSAFEHFAQ